MPTFDCPICQKSVVVVKTTEAPFRPFCSQRCKLVDLGRWMDGSYRVSETLPGDAIPDDGSAEEDEKNLPR